MGATKVALDEIVRSEEEATNHEKIDAMDDKNRLLTEAIHDAVANFIENNAALRGTYTYANVMIALQLALAQTAVHGGCNNDHRMRATQQDIANNFATLVRSIWNERIADSFEMPLLRGF